MSSEMMRQSTWVIKLVQLSCVTISMLTFFTLRYIEAYNISSFHFVAAMFVSSFLSSSFLLIAYVFGRMEPHKTFYEGLSSCFYSIMVLISACLLFVMSRVNSGAIASGFFALLASFAFAMDTYLFMLARGILNVDPFNMGEPSGGPPPERPDFVDVNTTSTHIHTIPPPYNPYQDLTPRGGPVPHNRGTNSPQGEGKRSGMGGGMSDPNDLLSSENIYGPPPEAAKRWKTTNSRSTITVVARSESSGISDTTIHI